MYLADLLEQFGKKLSPARISALKPEIAERFDGYLETIADFMHTKGSYSKYVRYIKRAYRVNPNGLVDNLEQISQLYDQVNEVETLGTPVSFLMQNLKTVLPTFFFEDEEGQRETLSNLGDFFEDLDLDNVDESTPGVELYPSYVLARWIREGKRVGDVLDDQREIMFSSYCGLFFDMAAKVLNLNVDERVVLSLVRGPSSELGAIPVTFQHILEVEMAFWKKILTNILSGNKYHLKRSKLKKIKNVEEMDVGRALKYINVPKQAYAVFKDEFGIPISDFYVAEACANIIENVKFIADHGYSDDERAKLEAILKSKSLLA
ncbi:MAG: hypothetical protein ACTSU5_02380 [Promethearchaeota archaeon]